MTPAAWWVGIIVFGMMATSLLKGVRKRMDDDEAKRRAIVEPHAIAARRYATCRCTLVDFFRDARVDDPSQFIPGSKTHWRLNNQKVESERVPCDDGARFEQILEKWLTGSASAWRVWIEERQKAIDQLSARVAVADDEPLVLVVCDRCKGTGLTGGTPTDTCPHCTRGWVDRHVFAGYGPAGVDGFCPPML